MPQSSSSAAASNRLPRNFSVSAFPSITTYFLSSSLIFRSETRLAYRENTDQVDGFFLGVLARPALFATAYFRQHFEATARANLTRALDS